MRTASRFHRFLVLFLLLASLIPLSAAGATAQGDDCSEGLVYLEEEDFCVLPEDVPDDETEEDAGDSSNEEGSQDDGVDESDTGEGEDTEDLDQVDDSEDVDIEEEPGYIGEIYLQHFACDPGFDPLENMDNWEGLVASCVGSDKPTFTYNVYVDQELVATAGLQTSDDSWGEVSLPGAQENPIPAGYITIVVDEVEGYTTSWVNCVASLDDGSSRDLQPSLDGGNAASFAVEPDEYVVCEWFNAAADQSLSGGAGTSFTITKYACQGDYLPDPQEDPWSFYSASCTETVAGQQFTLQEGEDGPTRSETGEDGTLFLQDIPVSDPYEPPVWMVSERIPEGYGEPVVFCGPAGESRQQMIVVNGSAIRLSYDVGVTALECDWYNIPGESAPATISIQSWLCESAALAEEELAGDCTQPAPNISFSLLSETEFLNSLATDDSGAVTFENVPPGNIAIAEDLPSGYGPVLVTCDHDSTAFGQQQITPNIQFGNGFTIEIDAGDMLDCNWYNLPALGSDTGPNIAIEGYQCPPSTAVTAESPLDEALAQCINPAFDTTYDILIGEELITSAYSGDSGQVFFTKLPILQEGETYGLRMMPGETDEVLAAWCDIDSGDGNYVPIETPLQDGNRIDVELPDGANMRCTWFSRLGEITTPEPPGPGGTTGETAAAITVDARFCPPEIETQVGEYEDLCPYPGPDVDFELSLDGDMTETATSDESGRVQFAGSEDGGTYLIRHVPNPGYSLPAITCVKTTDGIASEPIYDALTEDTGFIFELEPGETIACSWYILIDPDLYVPKEEVDEQESGTSGQPSGETGINEVIVQFWICPATVDISAPQEDLLLGCQVETEDRDLSVTIGGETAGQSIPGYGTWSFGNSTFALDTMNTEPGSVWCSSTWTVDGEDEATFPEQMPIDAGVLSLTLEVEGTVAYCDWFVAPVDAGMNLLPAPDMNIEFPGAGQGLEAFSIAQYGCLPSFDVTPPLPNPVPLGDLYCQGAALPSIQYAVEIKGSVYFNTSLQQSGVSSVYEYPDPAALPAGTTRIKVVPPAQFQALQVDCTSGPGNSVRHDNLPISADGWISFDTTPGSNVWCSFRVGPTAAWQGAQVKINSYTCNQSFDLYTTDSIQRSNNCELDTIPVSFEATLGGTGLGHIVYDGDGWGELIATPTQAGGTGTLRLTQPFVDGYGGMPRVYCTILAPGGATNLEPTMIDGASIEIQAPNNSLVVCEWFRPLKTIG